MLSKALFKVVFGANSGLVILDMGKAAHIVQG